MIVASFFLSFCLSFGAKVQKLLLPLNCRINQSINQSNFYSANIPGVARLSGATARSVFKYEVVEVVSKHQQAVGHTGVYGGKAKSKRYVLRRLLKVATEVAERKDSGRLKSCPKIAITFLTMSKIKNIFWTSIYQAVLNISHAKATCSRPRLYQGLPMQLCQPLITYCTTVKIKALDKL